MAQAETWTPIAPPTRCKRSNGRLEVCPEQPENFWYLNASEMKLYLSFFFSGSVVPGYRYPGTIKPLSSVARWWMGKPWLHSRWCQGNTTHAPPARKPGFTACTTKPLSSVARWCHGNGTPALPAVEKKSLAFEFHNVEFDDFSFIS